MSDAKFITFPGRKRAHVFVFPTTTPPNPPSVALVYTLQFFQYDNYVQWNYMCIVWANVQGVCVCELYVYSLS